MIELSDEEKERFQDAMMPVYQRFCADYMDVIDRIVKVGEEQ